MAIAPVRVGAVVSVALVAALIGCGGSAGAQAVGVPGASTAAKAKPVAVKIKDFKFTPETLRVRRGQKIKVTNLDRVIHTITATDKSFDSKNLKQGQSYTFTIAKRGTYEFFCEPHQYMTGKVVVS